VNQPPLNPDALAQLIMWKELPFGGNPDNYIRLDANAAHAVIELLKPHLAAALPEVTSVEELDQLPQGAVIMATGGQWNPDYPELFLKAGYTHAPWLALDPSDRDDGENLESSGATLKWRCDGAARVLYRPSEQP